MPKTVVLPLDGSDVSLRAVPIARRLATTFGAEVVLMTTRDTPEPAQPSVPEWLDGIHRSLGVERARVALSRSWFAVNGVVDVVRGLEDAWLCMATHGRGRIGTTILGSVARDVLRAVTTPVVLVGPHCSVDDEPTGPLVIGHDGSRCADSVIEAASDWAKTAGVAVVLVFVYHPLDVESAQHTNPGVEQAAAALRFAGVATDVHAVASSYPVGAILSIVENVGASALAVGTHGRSGAGAVVLGSVAGSLVHAAPCPVLVRRPSNLG
jgi:nucleotide-binding universal stress UspA family protein